VFKNGKEPNKPIGQPEIKNTFSGGRGKKYVEQQQIGKIG